MAENFHQCTKSLYVDREELETTTHTSSSSDHMNFLISLVFSCNVYFFDCIIPENSRPRLVRAINSALIETRVMLDLNQLLCRETFHEILNQHLEIWPLWACGRLLLVDYALGKAQDVYTKMPSKHNDIHMQFRTFLIHRHVYDENRAIMRGIQLSVEEDEWRMVRALESSIEILERKVLVDDAVGRCSICLEDFLIGCEGVFMPCEHVFHGDCIKKWLKTSHYCPICRFEMPVS